jgi:hypothetical protein
MKSLESTLIKIFSIFKNVFYFLPATQPFFKGFKYKKPFSDTREISKYFTRSLSEAYILYVSAI